jgi:hypothetical protein
MKEGNQEDLFEFKLSILASSIPAFLINLPFSAPPR